jgi:F420-non-reducing hydrogenase iron-sulfur subunit
VHAIERGFDGVFVASDGEECAYLPDCSARAARIVAQAQELLTEGGFEPQRLKMAAICSVCAEAFTKHMRQFSETLSALGPSSKG